MTSFVRFILLVVVVGIIVNFTIVVVANSHSQKRELAEDAQDRRDFETLIEGVNGRPRHADIAVEWQKSDALGQVLETSILVRCYYLTEAAQPAPLPLKRVLIDGNRVYVDALTLDFDPSFAQDNEEFRMLRNMKLSYFDHIYSEGAQPEDGFRFLELNQPPELTRIHPEKTMPGFFEMRLWRYLWDSMQEQTNVIHPNTPRLGVKITRLKPAALAVQNGQTYTAFLDNDGLTLERDNTPGLLNSMLREAEEMKDGTVAP